MIIHSLKNILHKVGLYGIKIHNNNQLIQYLDLLLIMLMIIKIIVYQVIDHQLYYYKDHNINFLLILILILMEQDNQIYINHQHIDQNNFNGIIFTLPILELIEEHMHKFNLVILIVNLTSLKLIISLLKIFIFTLVKINSTHHTQVGYHILELHFVTMDLLLHLNHLHHPKNHHLKYQHHQ